ncbi:MAG: YdeI/OmpD-associated family protein [Bacteroidota bacterium]
MHVFAGPVLLTDSGYRMHCIPIPPEIDEALGGARAVTGTLASPDGPEVSFRRAVHGRGDGAPRLHFGKTMLKRAGLAYGDTALIELAPADPDEVHLPEEFAAALAQDDEARARFETFTPGRQRSLGVHVDQAKRSETRMRRALELCEKIRTHTLHTDRRP